MKTDARQVAKRAGRSGLLWEAKSDSSGRPCRFGYTPADEYIIVIYERIDDDMIYPVTAYHVPEP
ncbi:MAG: hypothetical protein NTY19_51120 [Planctomycetota bacterium]|nr:hypothetical protein [Planctomycetota bacterium]